MTTRDARAANARQLVGCAECLGDGYVYCEETKQDFVTCEDCDGAGSFYVTYVGNGEVKVDRLPEGKIDG